MKTDLAYQLLSDLDTLKENNALEELDFQAVLSSKLSHKYGGFKYEVQQRPTGRGG